MPTTTTFGLRLRQLREEAGLTGAELAERAGVSRATVRRAEAGEFATRMDIAERLAAGLGLSLGQLLGGAGLDGVEER
jgi:transcriptional regulator with XRE-family HTH domain